MLTMISAVVKIACYFVYLPLIANQAAVVDPSSTAEYRVYLPLILNQVQVANQVPVANQEPASAYRVYLPLVLNQAPVHQANADAHDCGQEYKVYLPYIVSNGVPNSPPPSVLPPEVPPGFPSGTVKVRLHSRDENHLPGSTVVTTCGQKHDVTISFSQAYQSGKIEVMSVEKEKHNGQIFDLLDASVRNRQVTVDSREQVKATLIAVRDGVQFEIAAPATTTIPALIPDETLINAGYCASHPECEIFKRSDSCHGYLSWDIVFS